MNKQIIVYEPNEQVKMEVKTDGETVWLSQDQMCRLFGRDQSVIARHIKNIFKEGELDETWGFCDVAEDLRFCEQEIDAQGKNGGRNLVQRP